MDRSLQTAEPDGTDQMPDMAQICGTELFMGFLNRKTLEQFAREQSADAETEDVLLPASDNS